MKKISILFSSFLIIFIFSCQSVIEKDTAAANSDKTIKIASFNIQIFGKSKIKKKEVLSYLVKIVQNYDIIAIQEIRDKSNTTMPAFIDMINTGDYEYNYIISDRLGRSSSKEQYVFLYNTETIKYTGKQLQWDDTDDIFEREPYLAMFKASNGKFDFVLCNIHTKPDDAEEEIMALEHVISDAEDYFKDPDVIVLGDFNADGNYFSESITTGIRSKGYSWIISDYMDTNVASGEKTYDRIVITKSSLEDYSGKSNVFYYDKEYNLDKKLTKSISDHYLVYAEFYIDRDSD